MKHGRIIIPVLWLACAGSGCSVSEQSPSEVPGEVRQKFERGIQGKGKVVPHDPEEQATTPLDSANSPTALPSGSPP